MPLDINFEPQHWLDFIVHMRRAGQVQRAALNCGVERFIPW